jgi:pimeloyl-ACP methyl ester carboxylesterase
MNARAVRLEGQGLTLAGDEVGPPDGRPVLLLHGGGQNRYAWKGTADELAAHGYRVLSLDARGHGDSDWPVEADYDMEHFASDLMTVLDTFDEPPVIVGASMGGITALVAQSMRPDEQLFAALVLVDVTPEMEPEGVERIMAFMTANPEGFASLDEAADAIAAYNPARSRSGNVDGLKKVLRQRPDGRWYWHWDVRFMTGKGFDSQDREARRQRMAEFAERLMAAAKTVTMPVLLVRGLLSDLVSDRTVASFRAAVPHAEFVEIARAGHMVAGDRNDHFSGAVVEFLGRHAPAER